MLKQSILLASLITVSACQSSDQSSGSTSDSSPGKAGNLVLDFSKTEVKTDNCLPTLKLKEIDTKNIAAIKAVAEMYDTSDKKFNSIDIDIKVNHPLATVLFYPQDVECKDLSLKIKINECTSKTDNNQVIKCPSITSKGTEMIKDISIITD